ncbi:MAG: hypothetical protein KC910_14310 [Candidatus Eremiobacteraeota bacterium]|nr:hypothetical protein [Candidatus Eremiobacteraeota bacterium]
MADQWRVEQATQAAADTDDPDLKARAEELKTKKQEPEETRKEAEKLSEEAAAHQVIQRLYDSFPAFMRPVSQVDDNLSSYDALMQAKLKDGTPYVVAGKPDQSGLLTNAHFTGQFKPGEADILKQWIAKGAPSWDKKAEPPKPDQKVEHFGIDPKRLEQLKAGKLGDKEKKELAESMKGMLERFQGAAEEAYGGGHPDYFNYDNFADDGYQMLLDGRDASMPPGFDDVPEFWKALGVNNQDEVDAYKDHLAGVVGLWEKAGKPNWEVKADKPVDKSALASRVHELISTTWAEHIPEEKRSSYEAFMQAKDSFGARYVVAGKPEESAFLNYAQMDNSPQRDERVQAVRDWIAAGAPSWETGTNQQNVTPPPAGERTITNFFGAGAAGSDEFKALEAAGQSGQFSQQQKDDLARTMQAFTQFWIGNGAAASHQEYFQHDNFVGEGGALDVLINQGASSAGKMPPNSNLKEALQAAGEDNPDTQAWRAQMAKVASLYKQAGAPDWNQLAPTGNAKPVDPIDQAAPITSEVRDTAMLDYLKGLDCDQARNTRFFTLDAVGKNQDGSYSRRAQLNSLTMLLNNMHFNPEAVKLKEVAGSQGQVYALDMRDMIVYDGRNYGRRGYDYGGGYGGHGGFRSWTNGNEWQRVLSEYPYGLTNHTSTQDQISALTGTSQSQVRGDWFTAQAVGNFALDLVMPGVNHTNQLEHIFGIDRRSDFLTGNMMRAGFTQSGVANEHRVVDVHQGKWGSVWWSYDFNDTNFNQNIYANPLGPFQFDHRGDNPYSRFGFQTAASEILLRLPGGGTLAVLSDGNGNFANNAPENIAWNRLGHHGGPTIFSVGSGLVGHSDGMQPIHHKDEMYHLAHQTDALPPIQYGGYGNYGGYGGYGGYNRGYLDAQRQLQRITRPPEDWARIVTEYNLANYEHYQRLGIVSFEKGELDKIRGALRETQGADVTNSLTTARTASTGALGSFGPNVGRYHNTNIEMSTVASEMNLNDQQLTSLQDAIRSGDSRLDSIGHYYGIENLSATLAPLLRGGENHGIKRESFEQAFPAIARFLGTGSPQLFDFYDHGGKLGIGGPFRDGSRKLGGKRLTASDNANADKLNGENDNKRNTNNNNRGRCNGNRKMNNDRDADLEDIVAAQARMLLLAAGRGLPQRGRSFVDPSMVSAAGGNLAPLASSFLSNLERMDELGIEPSKKNELLILAATPVAISILMANSLGGRLANLDLGGFGREAAFQPFVA